MELRKWPSGSMTVTGFSPESIVIQSKEQANPLIKFGLILSCFLIFFSAASWIKEMQISYLPAPVLTLTGVIILCLILFRKQGYIRMEFNNKFRLITGLNETPISFSKIIAVFLSPIQNSDLWRLDLQEESGKPIPLVQNWPLDLAVCVGSHLGHLLARPFKIPKTFRIKSTYKIDWCLPYKEVHIKPPVGWMILSAAVAVLIVMIIDSGRLDFFHHTFWPKWIFIPAIGLPGMYLVSIIQNRIKLSISYASALILSLLMLTVAAFSEGVPVQMIQGWIPGIFLLIILIGRLISQHKAPALIALTLVCFLLGGTYSGLAGIAVYQLRTLDPGVVQRVEITPDSQSVNSDERIVMDRPETIRPFIEELKILQTHDIAQNPRSIHRKLIVNRPFTKDFHADIFREGAADRTAAVIQISQFIGSFNLFRMEFSSSNLDHLLNDTYAADGLWPPRK